MLMAVCAEDPTELTMVKNSLLILIKKHPKEALAGLFGQVMGDDDMTREKCIEFVCNSVMKIKNELFATNFDTEQFFIEQIKQVILLYYLLYMHQEIYIIIMGNSQWLSICDI